MKLTITIETDEAGLYVASVNELAGCHTQGRTLQEALERITEAIALDFKSDDTLPFSF